MKLFSKKYTGVDSRMGGVDRRYGGRWAKHIWGIVLLLAFTGGGGIGYNLRTDAALADSLVANAAEGDSIRSQVILDSLISLSSRQIQRIEVPVVSQVVIRDTLYRVDTLLVTSDPQIVEVVKEVLVIDTVYAPPQIITIPAPEYGFFSSEFFKPRAGNLLYLLGGVALGTILDNDASACIFVSTDGTVRENCDPKR